MYILSFIILLLTALTSVVFLPSRKVNPIAIYSGSKTGFNVFLSLVAEGTFFNFSPVRGEGLGKFWSFKKGGIQTKKRV